MDYRKIKMVSIFLLIAGISFLFSQFQGISGFTIGEGAGLKFNIGVAIILLAIIILVLASRSDSMEPSGERLFYDGEGEIRTKKHGKVNIQELKRQKLLRSAREKFIELYAKEPKKIELDHFIDRLEKEGRLKEIE